MSRLGRYLIGTVLGFTAIVGLALVAIYTFISFVAEIDEAGEGSFGMLQLLWYTLMMLPSGLYVLMPIIALLGATLARAVQDYVLRDQRHDYLVNLGGVQRTD